MNFIKKFQIKTTTAVNGLYKQPEEDISESKTVTAGKKWYLPSCDEDKPRDTIINEDVSGSMGYPDYPPTRLDGGIEAAIEYINTRSERNPADRIAVVAFTESARIVIPLTPICEKMRIVKAIQSLTSGGGTDIAKGLGATIRIFDQEPDSDHTRHIILLTDGQGGHPIKKAKILKEKYNAVINTVGIGGSNSAVNESLLRKIATTDADGCHYRFIKDSETLKKHYHELATSLVWRGEKK